MFNLIDTQDNDIPSKDFLSQETRRKWFHELCLKHVESFLMSSQEMEPLVQQVQELLRAMAHGFNCHIPGCEKYYIHHSARVKYVTFAYIEDIF